MGAPMEYTCPHCGSSFETPRLPDPWEPPVLVLRERVEWHWGDCPNPNGTRVPR